MPAHAQARVMAFGNRLADSPRPRIRVVPVDPPQQPLGARSWLLSAASRPGGSRVAGERASELALLAAAGGFGSNEVGHEYGRLGI